MVYDCICPQCQAHFLKRINPVPTVDVVIYDQECGLVLIQRKNPPLGWALPGGFVDYGETVEAAAIREAKEETSLTVCLISLLGVYSDPARDPRLHTISTVFTAQAQDIAQIKGRDDAVEARFFPFTMLPVPLAFDHGVIVNDFLKSFDQRNP